MAEMDLNQDKVSVPLLMLHRDQGLCPCESGQHNPIFLPTHPTCINVSSFSLTLAEVGQSLLGETEARSQPGPPAH